MRESTIRLVEIGENFSVKDRNFAHLKRLVSNIRISPDQKYVAVGTRSGRVFIYRVKNENELHEVYE